MTGGMTVSGSSALSENNAQQSSSLTQNHLNLDKMSLHAVFLHPYPDEDLSNDCFLWTGSAIRPAFTLYSGSALIPDTDYIITEYNNNTEVSTDNDKATITIEGINNASGTATLTFTILPVELTETVAYEDTSQPKTTHIDAVSMQVQNPVYSGKDTVRPVITITYHSSTDRIFTLAEGVDYEVTYSSQTVTGGDYTITYKNHFKGTFQDHYETTPIVLDEAAHVTCSFTSLPYKGTPYSIGDFGISVTAAGLTLSEGTDYTLSAADDLKDAGSHIITIAAAAEKDGDDSANKKFTGIYGVEVSITPIDLSEANKDVTFRYTDPSTTVYNGDAQSLPLIPGSTPSGFENLSLTYQVNGSAITARYQIDYKIESYKNNINAGTATAILAAASDNFTGTREVTFSISPFDLSVPDAAQIADIAEQEYTGSAIEPAVSVTASLRKETATPLRSRTDYTVYYSNHTNVGKSAKVTITGTGNYTGSITKTFTIKGNETAFRNASVSAAGLTYNGSVQSPVITASTVLSNTAVTLSQGIDYTVQILAADGVTPAVLKDAGSYVLKLTGTGNFRGTVQTTITMEKANLKDDKIRISFHDYDSIYQDVAHYIYNGSPYTPDIALSIDGHIVQNTDASTGEQTEYRVSYKNNRLRGTATVIIKALGRNMTGETTASFRIGEDIDAASIAFTEPPAGGKSFPSYTFTGGEIKPSIRASIGDKLLVEGQDYIVNYENNIDASTDQIAAASVSITGIGAYAGVTHSAQGVKSFQITPLLKVDPNLVTFHDDDGDVITSDYVAEYVTGKPFKISEVQINHVPVESKNYILSYSGNGAIGHATVTLDWQGTNIKQGQSEIVIEFDVRRLLNNATVTSIPAQIYNGQPIMPFFTVFLRDGNTILWLTKDIDYTVSYTENINAGDAEVTISGIKENGIYAGTLTTEFEILPRSLTDAHIAPIPSQTFISEETEIMPPLSVTVDGVSLKDGVDYEAEYEDNDAAGIASVTISPVSDNYDGEAVAYFEILPRNIQGATIVVPDCFYTGEELEPEAKVLLGGEDITEDLSLEYSDNLETGTACVTAYGTDNYEGSVKTNFKIKTESIHNVKFRKIPIQFYTGKALKPLPVLTNNGVELEEGNDYSITYSNNKKPGTGTVVLTGDGKHYKGKLRLSFKIAVSKVSSLKATVKAGGELNITAGRASAKNTISGYQICYRVKGKKKWNKINVEAAKKCNTTLSMLEIGKNYEVRVRTYLILNKKKTFGAYSEIITTKKIK